LAAVSVFIYAPACHYGFLSYDDPAYVSQNAQVIRGLTPEGVRWAFITGHASNWHPVTWLSHMLDVSLFGMNAGRHHCVNLLLHIANAILLFGLLCRTTGAWGPSAAVAALFAAHPLHVESVVWVAERKDVLSTLFGMLTMHAYVRYVRKPDPGRYLTVMAVFALGLMSKPMLVTLPLVLLLMDLWPLNRVRFEAGSRRVWPELLREKMPLFLLSAASSAATILAQWRGGAVQDFELLPMHQRAANALVSYAAYLGRMLWPANLAPYYPYQPLPAGIVLGCALILAAVSAFVIRFSRNRPFLFMGWFWYVITLVPVIGLIQVGGQARADRYTYIPLIGIFIIAAWGIPLVFEGRQGNRTILAAAACILVCVLAAGARNLVRYWESDLSLWRHAVEKTGENYFARTNLGFALMAGGDLDAAVAQFNEALRIRPESAETHNGLGTALLKLGRPDAALERFTTAVRLRPGFAEARSNRGMALAQRGIPGRRSSNFKKLSKSVRKAQRSSITSGSRWPTSGSWTRQCPIIGKL
jgi:tetratricopeptide (TPR) repeat protein